MTRHSSTPLSKQMGQRISDMIGLAQRIKEKEKSVLTPAQQQDESWVYWKHECKAARALAVKLNQELMELKARKLANFSLDEIERELQRRAKTVDKTTFAW